MTDAQERARAVYEQLGNSTEMVLGHGVDVLKMQDDDIAVISAALAQVEEETWGKVIDRCDAGQIGTPSGGYDFIEWCRQQAQRAKEGKG